MNRSFKFWQPPKGESLDVRFLESLNVAPSFWLNTDGLLEMREVSFVNESSVRYQTVYDLDDQQVKMMSITKTGQELIRKLMAEYAALQETQRLVDSQREAAQRFKYTRMRIRHAR